MTQQPSRGPVQTRDLRQQTAVVSAYGAFRLLLVLLAGWSFFAGFALLTGFAALSYEGGTASRVAGSYMIVLAPVYLLLAWRRDEYRMLLWLPYAAQAAVIIPGLWQLVFDQEVDAPLILVVSMLFFVLLVYMWVSSHPLDFFNDDEDEQPEEEEDDEAEELDEDDEAEELEDDDDADTDETGREPAPRSTETAGRGRRYRRAP